MRTALLLLTFLLPVSPAFAEPPALDWPVACTRGEDCWIVNYVDRDAASAAWQDFRCGSMTYDGHKGTDIAVRDRKAMEQGVPVLAAADGVVLRLRNDVADHNGEADAMGAAKQSGTECGNGVIIAHEDDWTTQYCHMRAGSIIVKPGQTVRAGDRLGMVGQSGMAQFPHLHFGIMQGDVRLDPFTGEDMASSSSCGAAAKASMWKTQIPYDPAMFTAAGFSPKPPVFEELLKDASSPQTISLSAPALAFWFLLHGARAGDGIEIEVRDPSGALYADSRSRAEKTQARIMRYAGKKNTPQNPLHPGTYTATAKLSRGEGAERIERVVVREVEVR